MSYPLEGQRESYTLIEDVEGRIDSASSKISEAEREISEAERMGASVNEAIDSMNSARNDLEDANTYISRANTDYDDKNFRSAQDDATIAENKAESAVDDANDAIDRARAAIQQRKNNAEEQIDSASGKLEELQSAIGKLEDKIEKASSNGLDVSGEEQTLENSRGMLGEVESSLDEATTSSDNGNYGEALNNAEEAFQKANSALDNVRSTVSSLEESIPDSGSSSVPLSVESTVKNLLDGDQEVSQEKAELRANNFESSGLSITKTAGESTYSVESVYAHPSGETVTLSSTVNTAEGMVGDVSLSGDASQINQGWEETQSAQQTRNSILTFGGVAILLIISGAFAYYFVNPVNKTVNNFVGEDRGSDSGRTFNCSNCDAPISPDDLEDGECPYCGATVSV
jgi:DNA repair exonuclease SbcCD ATPase subunit